MSVEGVGVGLVVSFAVGDGQHERLAFVAAVGEAGVGALDADVLRSAAELETFVAEEGPGEEARFTENLEAVAGAKDGATGLDVAMDGVHDWGEAGDCAAAEIVAVGEAAGKDDGVVIVEVCFAVPDEVGRMAQAVAQDVLAIAVTPRAGEYENGEAHPASSR